MRKRQRIYIDTALKLNCASGFTMGRLEAVSFCLDPHIKGTMGGNGVISTEAIDQPYSLEANETPAIHHLA